MKGRKSLVIRALASVASAAIVLGSIAVNSFADDGTGVGFDVRYKGFNVYGIAEDGSQIKTTYSNYGYSTKLYVDGRTYTTNSSNFAYGRDFYINDNTGHAIATANVTATINNSGNAVILTYTVTNNSDTAKEIKIGSSSDCQIGGNDHASVRAYENGLSMTDPKNANDPDDDVSFYLLPGNEHFTTLWSGWYGSADGNTFNNLDTHDFNGDSGLAWSWTMNVPAGATVTRTATIAAGVQLTSYTVNFDANGGTGSMSSHYYVTGVTDHLPANEFAREGYNFLGWSTDPNATAPAYTDAGEITVTSDMTLYAVWERIITDPTYTAPSAVTGLTYNGQPQALITAGSTEDGTMQYSLNANGTFSDAIPTGTASGDYTVYYKVIGDEAHYDSAVESVDVSIAPLNVNVYFDSNPVSVSAEEAVARPEDPVNEGYVFSGWFTDTECTTLYDFSQPVGTSDIYLYSGWNVVVYTFTEGAGASFVPGSEDPIVLRAVRNIDEPSTFSHFTGVIVDGEALDPSLYTAESGSVIVTIGADYLNTLPEGTHTIELTFDDAAPASTSIVISAAPVESTESTQATVPSASTLPSESSVAPVETTAATTSATETAAPSETTAPAQAATTTTAAHAQTAASTDTSVLGVSRPSEETTAEANAAASSEETSASVLGAARETDATTTAATPTPTTAPAGVANTGEASHASRSIMGIALAVAGIAVASCFVARVRKEEI